MVVLICMHSFCLYLFSWSDVSNKFLNCRFLANKNNKHSCTLIKIFISVLQIRAFQENGFIAVLSIFYRTGRSKSIYPDSGISGLGIRFLIYPPNQISMSYWQDSEKKSFLADSWIPVNNTRGFNIMSKDIIKTILEYKIIWDRKMSGTAKKSVFKKYTEYRFASIVKFIHLSKLFMFDLRFQHSGNKL